MCDNAWGFDAREVVTEVLAIDVLGPTERAILLTVVLGGIEFVDELSPNSRTKYLRLVETEGLPGPRRRGPGRPQKAPTTAAGVDAAEWARRKRESAWRPSRAS